MDTKGMTVPLPGAHNTPTLIQGGQDHGDPPMFVGWVYRARMTRYYQPAQTSAEIGRARKQERVDLARYEQSLKYDEQVEREFQKSLRKKKGRHR